MARYRGRIGRTRNAGGDWGIAAAVMSASTGVGSMICNGAGERSLFQRNFVDRSYCRVAAWYAPQLFSNRLNNV